MSANASRTGVVGSDEHELRDRSPSLAASTSPTVGPSLRRNPKRVIHSSSKIFER